MVGPPEPTFAAQLGRPALKPVMALLSRKIRRHAKRLGVRYRFLFMQANGEQLKPSLRSTMPEPSVPSSTGHSPSTKPSRRWRTSNKERPGARSSSPDDRLSEDSYASQWHPPTQIPQERVMMINSPNNEPTPITSYALAPTQTVQTNVETFAYRELGPKGGIPVVFFVHLAGTLDNWDPRIVDPIAATRHVITFDQLGVGASSGAVPATLEQAADDAYEFITALGYNKIDIFSFSMGGMIAQDLIVKHPNLVRKLVLTGTGPRGGKDMDKVIGTTYWDVLRATITRSDAKKFLFFNRDLEGKRAAKEFLRRLTERTQDRDQKITLKAFATQLKAIKAYGQSKPADLSVITGPTLIANGDNDRMVPSVLSNDLKQRIPGAELIIYPNSGHGGIFQHHEEFAPVVADFLAD